MIDARKTRIAATEAWDLLREAKSIAVAKGKKVERLLPDEDGQKAVLARVMGPSGNLRAPALRIGNDFFVGFNAELYEKLQDER